VYKVLNGEVASVDFTLFSRHPLGGINAKQRKLVTAGSHTETYWHSILQL